MSSDPTYDVHEEVESDDEQVDVNDELSMEDEIDVNPMAIRVNFSSSESRDIDMIQEDEEVEMERDYGLVNGYMENESNGDDFSVDNGDMCAPINVSLSQSTNINGAAAPSSSSMRMLTLNHDDNDDLNMNSMSTNATESQSTSTKRPTSIFQSVKASIAGGQQRLSSNHRNTTTMRPILQGDSNLMGFQTTNDDGDENDAGGGGGGGGSNGMMQISTSIRKDDNTFKPSPLSPSSKGTPVSMKLFTKLGSFRGLIPDFENPFRPDASLASAILGVLSDVRRLFAAIDALLELNIVEFLQTYQAPTQVQDMIDYRETMKAAYTTTSPSNAVRLKTGRHARSASVFIVKKNSVYGNIENNGGDEKRTSESQISDQPSLQGATTIPNASARSEVLLALKRSNSMFSLPQLFDQNHHNALLDDVLPKHLDYTSRHGFMQTDEAIKQKSRVAMLLNGIEKRYLNNDSKTSSNQYQQKYNLLRILCQRYAPTNEEVVHYNRVISMIFQFSSSLSTNPNSDLQLRYKDQLLCIEAAKQVIQFRLAEMYPANMNCPYLMKTDNLLALLMFRQPSLAEPTCAKLGTIRVNAFASDEPSLLFDKTTKSGGGDPEKVQLLIENVKLKYYQRYVDRMPKYRSLIGLLIVIVTFMCFLGVYDGWKSQMQYALDDTIENWAKYHYHRTLDTLEDVLNDCKTINHMNAAMSVMNDDGHDDGHRIMNSTLNALLHRSNGLRIPLGVIAFIYTPRSLTCAFIVARDEWRIYTQSSNALNASSSSLNRLCQSIFPQTNMDVAVALSIIEEYDHIHFGVNVPLHSLSPQLQLYPISPNPHVTYITNSMGHIVATSTFNSSSSSSQSLSTYINATHYPHGLIASTAMHLVHNNDHDLQHIINVLFHYLFTRITI